MKNIICLIAFLLIALNSSAGIVDLRFAKSNKSNDTYTIVVQMKSQDVDFKLGNATIFFEYNTMAIQQPTVKALQFGTSTPCPISGEDRYDHSFTTLEHNKGEGNYAILLKEAYKACPNVTTDWVDVFQLQFKIVEQNESPQLSFNSKYTAFNTYENAGQQHENGTFGVLDDFSGVTSINNSANSSNFKVTISPTITTEFLDIQYLLSTAETVQMNIYDQTGKQWGTNNLTKLAGAHTQKLFVKDLPEGYYFLQIIKGNTKKSFKFLKL